MARDWSRPAPVFGVVHATVPGVHVENEFRSTSRRDTAHGGARAPCRFHDSKSRITSHQLCQVPDIPSRHDLDAFPKHPGVPLEYTVEDFEREGVTSARLGHTRQHELA